MIFRVYLAPRENRPGTVDHTWNVLNNFIDVSKGERFDEIHLPGDELGLCTVWAEQATHDAIWADRLANPGRIVYLTDLMDGEDGKKAAFAEKFDDKPQPFKDAVRGQFDRVGADHGKIKADHTIKDVLRKWVEHAFSRQRAGAGGPQEDWEKFPFRFAGEDF